MFSRKVLLRAAICALLALVPFQDQENRLYDLKVRLLSRSLPQSPKNVLVLEMSRDEFEMLRKRFNSSKRTGLDPWREKFETLRNQFLWDDQVYAEILGKVLPQKPQKLLVSFFFHESLGLIEDQPRLQRLARNSAVLWASQFDLDQKLQKPAPGLTGTENYGFVNVYPDVDGVVRRAYLVYKNHISLPYRALFEPGHPPLAEAKLTDAFLLRYSGPSGTIKNCKVIDLFDHPDRCGPLKGLYVILSPAVGTGTGQLDRTPIGQMNRGELLGNILITAQTGRAIQKTHWFWQVLFVFAHCFGLALLVMNFRGRKQLIVVLSLLSVEAIFCLALLAVGSLHLPFFPFLLGTVLTYIAMLWLRFAQQESKRWQAEKKAQYLRELDELKSNFLSLMSHDLKTPIAKVQALTERLSREAKSLDDSQKEILSAIQRSNEELSQFIVSILNFQRIESRAIQLQRKSHDINLLIEEVVDRLAPLAEDRKIRIRLNLEPMFAAEFDEQLVRQVLTNLIDNAIKYNQPDTEVVVSSSDQDNFFEVSVQDNGVGIESEHMKRLFQKFSRSEKGTSERVKGTGLGLYLAKYFIELHGGQILVESQVGEGTTFRFRLPVK